MQGACQPRPAHRSGTGRTVCRVALVADALLRSTRSDIVGHVMVVDAKDAAAVKFYERLGFERLADDSSRLIRPL